MEKALTLEILGERLKKVRVDLGISQSELAKELNVYQGTISRVENGKGVEINLLLSIFHFYSKHIRIEILLNGNIDLNLMDRESQLYKKPINEIAIEKINMVKEDLDNISKLLKE